MLWLGARRAARWTLVLALLSGCNAARPLHHEQAGGAPSERGDLMSPGDHARLAALSAARAGTRLGGGYRIGADDLLEVRIPDLTDAQSAPTAGRQPGASVAPLTGAPAFQQGLRVDAHGDITVPLLGTAHVAGLSPREVETDIAQRLITAGILRTPQVAVQIVEHRAQVVAVIGSVERPGLYPLTRPGATLADLVWAAGGPSKDAGRVVEFVPAEAELVASGAETATRADDGARPAASLGDATSARTPIRIDLDVLTRATSQDAPAVNPPAVPGDVISLAPGGSVLVDGWVDKPGSYPVTRGLTVGGAVAAAGGRLFPADQRRVSVTRVVAAREQRSFTVDLEAVARGVATDVPLVDGDVVKLPAAPTRLLPWGMWNLAKSMVHIGGSILLF